MTNIYVRSTDGSDADNGTTWALAKAKLAGADAIDAAGDTIFVSQVHSETSAAAVSLTFAGTIASPTKLLCVNDAAEPPTAVSTGATIATTGASNLRISGSLYCQGLVFSCGSAAANFASLWINFSGIGIRQVYENCDFVQVDTHPSNVVMIGNQNGGEPTSTDLINCRFKLSNAAINYAIMGKLHINGGSFISGTSTPSIGLFSMGQTSQACFALVENLDMTNLSSTVNLLTVGSTKSTKIIIRNCKLPASWTGSLWTGSFSVPTARAEMYNCDSGSTNYRLWIEDYAGSIKHETTIIKTGGASDGTTGLSWKMASNGNANESLGGLVSSEIVVWNDGTGSAISVTVDIVHDSVTALTDAEVWLDVNYLGASGSPLGTNITDRRSTTLATAANQTTSAVTWTTTGLTNPNKQALSVTFTPQKKGWIQATVVLAKASKTIYVDPVLQVA